MNSPTSDPPPARTEGDATTEAQALPEQPRLVEMGKVSETRGSWVGYKLHNGSGIQYC